MSLKLYHRNDIIKRNLTFFINYNFLITISLQQNGVNLYYFKLRQFDRTEFKVSNIESL